jgi:glycosyltransferase involved in cell wall biosynthesis
MYEKSEVDVVIIPSIVTHDGEKEGIPVSLMEAMAYGIPVISTNTGSISELLGDGAGIMVPAKSSADIADSIWKLMQSKSLREKIARAGLRKVKESFNNIENTKNLIKMFESELKI